MLRFEFLHQDVHFQVNDRVHLLQHQLHALLDAFGDAFVYLVVEANKKLTLVHEHLGIMEVVVGEALGVRFCDELWRLVAWAVSNGRALGSTKRMHTHFLFAHYILSK